MTSETNAAAVLALILIAVIGLVVEARQTQQAITSCVQKNTYTDTHRTRKNKQAGAPAPCLGPASASGSQAGRGAHKLGSGIPTAKKAARKRSVGVALIRGVDSMVHRPSLYVLNYDLVAPSA